MKKTLICLSLLASASSFAFCPGGFGDPNYQACIRQEEANRIQKEMLELQRKQIQQQHIDNIMREQAARLRGW